MHLQDPWGCPVPFWISTDKPRLITKSALINIYIGLGWIVYLTCLQVLEVFQRQEFYLCCFFPLPISFCDAQKMINKYLIMFTVSNAAKQNVKSNAAKDLRAAGPGLMLRPPSCQMPFPSSRGNSGPRGRTAYSGSPFRKKVVRLSYHLSPCSFHLWSQIGGILNTFKPTFYMTAYHIFKDSSCIYFAMIKLWSTAWQNSSICVIRSVIFHLVFHSKLVYNYHYS